MRRQQSEKALTVEYENIFAIEREGRFAPIHKARACIESRDFVKSAPAAAASVTTELHATSCIFQHVWSITELYTDRGYAVSHCDPEGERPIVIHSDTQCSENTAPGKPRASTRSYSTAA